MRSQPHAAYSQADHERLQLGFTLDRGEPAGQTLRIAITANLVATNARALKPRVLEEIAATGVNHVRLDLEHCPYIDAAGLGVLVSIANATSRAGGGLTVGGANEDLTTLFELTGLDRLFASDAAVSRPTGGTAE